MWENLKNTVNNVIKPNDNREITGEKHNNTLSAVINSLGKYSQFAGLAFKNTNPGVPDGPVFYFAAFKGVYINFNRIEVKENEVAILNYNNNKWGKIVIGYSPIAPATAEDIRLTAFIDAVNDNNALKTNFEFKQDSIADVQLPFLHAAVSHIDADGQLIKGKPTSEVLIPVPLAEPSIDVDTPGKHGFMSYQDKDLLDSIPNYTISGKKISENPILTHDDIQGVAYLGEDGKIPSSLLPSYVDDVIEYDSIDNFPLIGEGGKIYLDKKTNLAYRWSGTTYVSISSSIALGETSSTAYAGDKGKKNAEDIADLKTNKADKTSIYTKEEVDYLLEHFKLPDHIKAITFSVDGILLSKNENGDLVIGGNVVVEGGISMYGPGQFGDSIMDYIIVDNESIKIIDGKLTVDPNFVGGGTVKGIKVNGYTYDEVDTNGYITIPDYPTELAWNSITGKPSTFTPSAHIHKIEDITDIADASVSHAATADRLKKEIMIWGQPFDGSTDVEGAISNVDVINMANADTVISLYIKDGVLFIEGDLAVTGGITMYASNGVTSGLLDQVYAILDSSKFEIENGVITIKGDIGDGKVKGATLGGVAVTLNANGILEFDAYPTTLPASDVYAWAKAATKPTYSWGEITEKPTSFTPSAHTHDDRYYTESEIDTKLTDGSVTKVGKVDVGSATKPIYLKAGVPTAVGTFLAVDITGNSATTSKLKTAVTLWGQSFDGSKAITGNLTNVGTITPTGEDLKVVGNLIVTGGIVMYADDGATIESGFAALLAAHIDGVTIKYNEAQQKIYSVMTGIKVNGTTYKPSETDGYITIPDYPTSLDWANIENKPSSFTPASHTHTFASLTSKPTTLSGYGITDAKIVNGVITLGTTTITPLTAHQTVTLASGTNNGTLKLTVGSKTTDNIAVKGLGSAAYTASSAYAAASHTHSQYLVASSLDGYVNALTDNTSTNVFVTAISKSGKTLSYTKSFTKKSLTAASHSGWSSADTDKLIIPDMSFIAYWNGAYNSSGGSNLAYCNKGAFGDMATASKSSYYTKTEVNTKLTDGSVTKLGTANVGSGTQHFYLSSGTATASTSTVGGTAKPMYLNAGVMTAISDTVGGTAKPIFLNAGTLTAISATVGSASKPVYLSGGSITACSYDFTSYLPLAGGTMAAGARISHADGNLYLGNADNNSWVMCQDICSQNASGDSYWSLRTDGRFHSRSAVVSGNTSVGSLTINGINVTKSSDGILKIDGNLIVTGGITMYATDGVASGLMEQILVDGTTIGKKADGTLYAINTGNVRSIIMGSTTYTPNSSGVVTLPEKVTWANIEGKPSTFAPSAHTHSYLPLAGGTLTGALTIDFNHSGGGTTSSLLNVLFNGTHDFGVVAKFHSYGNDAPAIRFSHSSDKSEYNSQVNTNWSIGMRASTYTDFAITQDRGTSGWGTVRFAINNSGNVGIGVDSASYKLHVAGDIYTTTGFKKNGSSDSYVLLGGGGHKLISDFATSGHTHSYLPLSGGTMSGYIYAPSKGIIFYGSVGATTGAYITGSSEGVYINGYKYVTLESASVNYHPRVRLNTVDYPLLSTYNYNSYVPTLTGTGASGTWGISITGNASSATKLTSSAGSATLPIYFSDGKPVACTASSVFSNLSNSGNNISVTVAGHNRTLTVGYADTVDGYHASNIMQAGWIGLLRTGGSASTIKWTRIGRFITSASDNVNNDAMIEFFSNGDQNYTNFGYGRLMLSSYSTSSSNMMLTSVSDGNIHFYATIDADRYIWLGHNAWWTGNSKYRVLFTGSFVEWYSSSLTTQTTNPNDNYITDNGAFKYNAAMSTASLQSSHAWTWQYNARVSYATSAGNSDTCDGLHVHGGRNNEANKIVRTDGSGYLQVGYINSSSGNEGNNSSPARVWGTNGSDNYMRTYLTSALAVATATKWATARKITLTGSVTGSVSIDGSGNVTLATTTNHTHSQYLPLAGGTMTGTLTTVTAGTHEYNQGIRINRTATNQWATLLIGKSGTATSGTGTSTAGDGAWLIATPASSNSLIFNLNSASETVGLCLKGHGASDMKWNNNTVLHAGNYSSYALPLSGGTMTAGARISHADGNLYLGRADNNGWLMCQDMCSQTASGDSYWSLRTDGTLHAVSGVFSSGITTSGNIVVDGTVDIGSNTSTVRYIYSNGIWSKSGSEFSIGANNTNMMRFKTNGNVGIGTTSPSQKLHVSGKVQSEGLLLVSGSDAKIVIDNTDNDTYWSYIDFRQKDTSYGTLGTRGSKTLQWTGGDFTAAGQIVRGGKNGNWVSGRTNAMIRQTTANAYSVFASVKTYAGSWEIGEYTASGERLLFTYVTDTNFNNGNNNYSGQISFESGGNIIASGGITMYSDLRKKNILSDEVLSVKEIAAAPLFRHTYKSDDNQYIHVGTSAQYWSGIHEDWFTRKDSEGYYQMELQNLGVAMGISLAREIVTFEGAFKKYESKTDKKIRLMKKKINDLEARIKELEGSKEERRTA